MWIGHCKEIPKLTFRAFALCRSESIQRRAYARNVSVVISLRWPIHIINSVDKTKLPFSSKPLFAFAFEDNTRRTQRGEADWQQLMSTYDIL